MPTANLSGTGQGPILGTGRMLLLQTNSVPSYVNKPFNLHKFVEDPYFPKQVLLRNILQNKAENI